MSTHADLQSVWTLSVIAIVFYRVIMVIVSIAFIWKKYRRPIRQFDGESLIGLLVSPHHIQADSIRPMIQSSQFGSPRSLQAAPSDTPQSSSTTQRDYRAGSWERRAQHECNRRRTSSSHRSSHHSTGNGIATGANLELDFELGDIGS